MYSKVIWSLGFFAFTSLCFLCTYVHGPKLLAGETAPPTSRPIASATFEIRHEDGKMILSGTFPDRAAKMQVLARARDVCGEEKFVDQLKVNSQTAFPHPRWMSTVLSSLVLAQRIGSDGGIYLEGTKMSLRGSIETEEMKRRLITDATTNAGTAWIDDQIIVKHKAQAKKEGN